MTCTRFNWFSDAWSRVLSHCRTTTGKPFTDKEPSERFRKALLIAEHSPIRLLEFDWTWEDMPYWVHAEWARHKFEKFVTSQRDDRSDSDVLRGQKPQNAPVTFDGYANMQSLIDAWRKRLCHQASPEARAYAEDFKDQLHETHPLEADALVPNCVYRGGCPEMRPCGLWRRFACWADDEGYSLYDLTDIQTRYDLYNAWHRARRQSHVD